MDADDPATDADDPTGTDQPTDVHLAAWVLAFGVLAVVGGTLALVTGWGGVETEDVLWAVATVLLVVAYYLARLSLEYHFAARGARGGERRARAYRNRLAALTGLAVAAAVTLAGYLTA